jgi:WD40 repeat protein
MDIDRAIEFANGALIQHGLKPLTSVERLILRGAWEHQTYEKISEEYSYSERYLSKDAGPRLWRDLTTVFGLPLSKTNFRTALEQQSWQDQLQPKKIDQTIEDKSKVYPKIDWGDAIDVSVFFGRYQEQEKLGQWINLDRCRLVWLLGMGGIGKTALAIKAAQNIQTGFEFLIWRSLQNAPPIQDVLTDIIQFISQRQDVEVAQTTEAAIAQLLGYLRAHRCLLILDNAEAILQAGDRTRSYRPGCESYDQLFDKIGETLHHSCLMVTGREYPQSITAKFGQDLPMRCLSLNGLTYQDGKAIFNAIGQFFGTAAEWQASIDRYSGNPLALKIMASFVNEVLAGDLSQLLEFFGDSTYIFDDIRKLLDQQFQRLSAPEQEVMRWIAIRREPVTLQALAEDLAHPLRPHELLQVLAALQSRSLIEKAENCFTQQPVVMEYVTSCLIEQLSQQIIHWHSREGIKQLQMLQQYALIQAQAKDYIKEIQSRLILQPVVDELQTHFGDYQEIERQLSQMLAAMRASHQRASGYGAGNIINILRYLEIDLCGYNFSQLTVWQADLQGLSLHDVNFSRADVSKSRFSQTFGWINEIAFSPDGELWAAGDSAGYIHLWSVATEKHETTLKAHQSFIFSLAFSPDSQLLVSSSIDGLIKLWEIKTGHCLHTLQAHSAIIWCVVFSRDGEWFASSCEDGTIKIWDCKTGDCLQTLNANCSSVRSITFTPNRNCLVSGSEDCLIRLWDLAQGKCVKTFEGHTQTIWSIDVSSNGQYIASGGNDTIVKLWDLQSGVCLHNFEGHSLQIWSIVFSPDDKAIASGSMDQTVRLWQIEDQQCAACFRGHSSMVMCVAFSADGKKLASGGMDRLIKHWHLPSKACIRTWSGYKNIIWSVAFLPSSSLADSEQAEMIASSSLDGMIRLWRLADGQCLKTMKHPAEVHAIALSPDGKMLVSGNMSDRSTLKVWEVQSGGCFMTIPAHMGKVNSVCFSHDGSLLASGGDDKTVHLFQFQEQRIEKLLQGHQAVVWSVAFSPDDRLLASGSFDQTVRIWDVASGQCLHVLAGHTNALTTIVFHPHQPIIATASSDAVIKLWSVSTGQCERTLTEHTNVVMGIAFSQDGLTFATGSYDKTIRIWDVDAWQCRSILAANSLVHSVAFSPDGSRLISGGDNGTLQLWDLETNQCIRTFNLPELYAGMKIGGVKGLTPAQQAMLIALGAIAD